MIMIMYTKNGCPWCDDVRDLLKSHHIQFEERECRENEYHFRELIEKSGQTLTPTLDIDGEILADTDRETVEKYLKEKDIISA